MIILKRTIITLCVISALINVTGCELTAPSEQEYQMALDAMQATNHSNSL